MATYQFSALADGQAISFNPNADVLNFDQTAIAGADIRAVAEGVNLRISVVNGASAGKDVLLTNVSPLQLAATNITFANGSRLLFGDNTTGTTADNAANSLTGTTGRDLLNGFGGIDTMNGGAGDDVYFVTSGDVLTDSGGIDTVVTDITWSLGTAFENLTMTGTGNITMQGNNSNNFIIGNAGNNTFNARAGNDTIQAGAGNDRIDMFGNGFASYGDEVVDGGVGFDTVDFSGYAKSAITVQIWAGRITGGGDGGLGTVSFSNLEMFVTGAFNDSLVGGDGVESFDARGGNDTMWGYGGNDTLSGGAGADQLWGGDGVDVLTGGADADRFLYHPWEQNRGDVITDFATGMDKFHLQASENWRALGVTGNFAAGDERFHAGAAAHDSTDRVIWDGSNLWVDVDGNGSIAPVRIASVTGTVVATDIFIENGAPAGTTVGGEGNDSLTGTSGADTIDGLSGNDTIDGLGGADSLIGGDGSDILNGGDGNDTLDGWYFGENGWENELVADTLNGGLGDDLFQVDHADDVLTDGGGVDTVRAADMDWTLEAGFENLVIYNDRSEAGGIGVGNELDNNISATYGPTRLEGRGGNDTLMSYPSWGYSTLLGGEGHDSLHGFGVLDGGLGNDSMTGGGVLVFSAAPGAANADIVDFAQSGLESIELDGRMHANIGVTGRFAADDARFYSAPGASAGRDADHRVIFDTSSGRLWYDADGSGSGSAQLIATFVRGGPVIAAHIEVVNGTSSNVFTGTAGNDSLPGTSSNDTIFGLAGDDTIGGLAGDDSMDGGTGNDIYYASVGDVLVDEGGIDLVIASGWSLGSGFENLTVVGSVGSYGAGNELSNVIDGRQAYNVNLFGGAGNDTLYGTDGGGLGAGIDTLSGGDGADEIHAGSNDDGVYGDAGNDLLFGEDGNDLMDGGADVDTMFGGAGNDVYRVTAGDALSDSDGIDTVQTSISWSLGDAFENLTMTGAAAITMQGNNLNNLIVGNSGNNVFNARAGDDTIQAGGGNDRIDMFGNGFPSYGNEVVDGGTGTDTIDFSGYARTGITVNLATGRIAGGGDGGAGTVAVSNVERVTTGAFNDSFVGNSAANLFDGRGGNDTLAGGTGNDTLTGGTGNDVFVFNTAPGSSNVERITDFSSAPDQLQFENAIFTAIGGAGTFTATDGRFWAAAGATAGHDNNDRVIYNPSTGSLYYDADGSGAGASILVATFQGNPAIAATDITVI